ncbi:MAG TPA: type I methionyl aminopeptidase [Candidatus Saccharimonadales bacterium]|nr:type I methionyl aminopeptidase [Candidatus Saccharimonadales bacterium]
MFTKVKTPREIEAMRESGRMLATVLQHIREVAESGMTGKDVSHMARQELKALGGKPAFFGYQGFPDVICISINDEIVHGIPNREVFADGDILSFDFGVDYKGMITDAAFSMIIGGKGTPQIEKLLADTKKSLDAAVRVIKDDVKVGDISAAVQGVLDKGGYGIVRDLVGHGVGHYVHEGPDIPNHGKAGTGDTLQAGMTIAVEPMSTLGDYKISIDPDGWTIRTKDGSLSAHFEHTILITEKGAEVLTTL